MSLSPAQADALDAAADNLLLARAARDALIVTCWQAGGGLCEIARHTDVSYETVRRIIRKQLASCS